VADNIILSVTSRIRYWCYAKGAEKGAEI